MAAGTKSTEKTQAEKDAVDALFDGDQVPDDDFDDLLDSVEEDDSEAWVPKEKGEGISGVVVKVGETRSDFAKPGEDAIVPTVTILVKETGIKWRVIGFSSVLKREIIDANPQVNDRMAVKYFGEKPIKSGPYQGRPYKHYGVAVRRAAA